MPLDPRRVQAVFLSAVEYHEPAERTAVLDRECSTDSELRQQVETLLLAHDRPVSVLDQPIVGPASYGIVPPTRPAEIAPKAPGPESPVDASTGPDPTVGVVPDADYTRGIGTTLELSARAGPAISGYEIMGELGRGGMGVVYRARQVRLNRPCAIKMILGGAHASPEAATRFLAEAEAVARLQHANIVQIHHIGEVDGLPYFELEYVDGGSLDRQLDGTPWPARRAIELIEAVARGVAEAHRQGIVHRDLKPANILMAADGTPRITDFGLAKSLASDSGLTRTDSIMGSPGYMAPEQAEGRTKRVGPPADVYALGAILYELLTGRPPFVGATVLETLEQVRTTEPVAPSRLVPHLPRDVETIALKCLHKDPVKRYESATALAEDLRRYLGGESILARPVGPIERGWRWYRRNPVVAGLAASLAALLVLATAASLAAYARMSNLASGEHAARLTAERETQAARDARVREAAQRLRAEANFRKARAAVDGYLTTVSESQLLKVPGLQPLRGELLESALRFYRDFLKKRGDDPTLRAELAATQARIGRIQTELGAVEAARRSLKSAIAAYQAEIIKNPQDLALRTALADAWLSLGDLAFTSGGQNAGQELLAACENNAELREGLARDRADDPDRQRDLADALGRLGVALDGAGRDGLSAHLRGAEIRLAHFLNAPDDPKLNFGIGESMNNIAACISNSECQEDILAMQLRGEDYIRFAYDRQPHMIEYGCDATTASMNVLRAYRYLGRKDETVAQARKAVEHCRRLVRDHPAAPIAKRQLVWALEELVQSQRDAGRTAEAARTAREFGQWLDLVADTPQWMFNGARWHSRLSLWEDERKSSPTNQEQDEGDREADRAVEQLRRAIEAGFADLEAIRKDKALDTLRGRADFQKLVANLEERLRAHPQGAPVATRSESEPEPGPASRAERVFRARVDRAAVLHAVGEIQRGRGRHDAARDALDAARVLCEQLIGERPGDAPLLATLVDTHRTLGRMDWDAGRLAPAEAHLAVVVAAAPGDIELRLTRDHILAELGRDNEARDDIARLLASAPLSQAASRRAAAVQARLARWDLAAETMATLLERDPGDHWNWCISAALRARAGDAGRYRRLSRRMLDRFRDTDNPEIAERTAKYSLLPLPGPEQEDAARLAERTVAGATEPLRRWAGAAKGLADYRRGRFADAVAAIEKDHSADDGREWNLQVMAGSVRAMALMRLGRREEARAALEKASGLYRSNVPQAIALDPGAFWTDLLICEVLLREAEVLVVLDPAFPADPFVQ